ncbi:MAG: hypothetical protein Q9163_000206 [Psora crenata]
MASNALRSTGGVGVHSTGPSKNPRKRHIHETPPAVMQVDYASAVQQDQAVESCPSSKRHRPAEWPLKSDIGREVASVKSKKLQTRSPPPQSKSRSKKSPRPSKFKEGSLNDKPSKHPPSAYIGQETAMEDYVKSAGEHLSKGGRVYDAGVEPIKPSGMFRFGKAIANALNPATVWQGINGIWREREQPVTAAKRVSQDRQDDLFRIYEDLKATGFNGINSPMTAGREVERSPVSGEVQTSGRTSFRDSAVDVGESRSSNRPSQELDAGKSLKAPVGDRKSRSVSPFLGANSGRRSLTHLRTPSFQEQRGAKSHIQLPSPWHWSSSTSDLPATKPVDNTMPTINPGIRRQPSKKDIARVYKLNKRVSDLELKLETARQELEQSLRDAPPVPSLPVTLDRKPFVPGNLPSLPSERTLSQYLGGRERTVPASVQANVGQNAMNKGQASRPESGQHASQVQSQPRNYPTDSTRDIKKSLRSGKAGESRTSYQNALKEQPITASSQTVIKKHRLPRVPSNTPRNSPKGPEAEVPSLPAPATIPDPSSIDQTGSLTSCVSPEDQVNFGKSAKDRINLEYPAATDVQLIDSSACQTTGDKNATRYLSAQHSKCPTSPSLRRPRVGSSTITRSQALKRGISPPPPSLASARKKRDIVDIENKPLQNTAVGRTSKLNYTSRATCNKPTTKTASEAGNTTQPTVNKPLPEIQKEDYQWDEDVF